MRYLVLAAAFALSGAGALAEPTLRLTSNLILKNSAQWFGGFSGAEVFASGSRITLLTDKSNLVMARLVRTAGVLTRVEMERLVPMKNANSALLEDLQVDSEGLAVSSDGTAYVSFERNPRVMRVDFATGRTTAMPRHPAFDGFDANKGLEALAIHPDGTLYTLPEVSKAKGAPFPLFALKKDQWQITHTLPRRGPFMAVGADFDTNGRLYLLERAVSPLGFRSRIRRFDLSTPDLGEITLLQSPPARFDNMEAISVWTNAAGKTQLTLISDDNFLSIQQTQIVEFEVTE